MLDEGRLLTKGELGLERRRVPVNKEDDSDIALIHFSPTINYAGLERFSPAKRFSDRKRKGATQSNVNMARVALQVALEPGSYKVGDSQVRENNNSLNAQYWIFITFEELKIQASLVVHWF